MEDDFLFDLDNANAIEQETQSFDELFDSNSEPSNGSANESIDYITATLNSKGINRNSVKFEDENGDIVEKRFDDLSEAEKFNILNSNTNPPVLSNQEIDVVNYMRSNGFDSIQDMVEYQQNQIYRNLQNNQQRGYTIDKMSDQELLRFDLQDKYPDLTPDELDELIDREISNPEILAKKINNLRQEYQRLEDDQYERDIQAHAQAQRAEFERMAHTLVNVAKNTDDIYGFQLEDNEKEEILAFLLNKDANGRTGFGKLCEDPQAVYLMSWFALHGNDAINTLNNYWKNELKKQRKDSNNTVYRRPSNNNTTKSDPGLDKYFK